jgi:branched-chain amino acid aminotransferase
MVTGYIRLSVSRGVGLGLDPSHMGKFPTIVISTEQLRLYPQEAYERGLDVITASTRVPPAVCIDPQVKSLGRYVNNIAAKMEANRVGAGEALMLNMQGNVAEATGDNIFLVKNGELVTPPTSEGALPGITRQAVMDLAKDMGLPCRQACMTLYDVYTADEAFLTGRRGDSDGDLRSASHRGRAPRQADPADRYCVPSPDHRRWRAGLNPRSCDQLDPPKAQPRNFSICRTIN